MEKFKELIIKTNGKYTTSILVDGVELGHGVTYIKYEHDAENYPVISFTTNMKSLASIFDEPDEKPKTEKSE